MFITNVTKQRKVKTKAICQLPGEQWRLDCSGRQQRGGRTKNRTLYTAALEVEEHASVRITDVYIQEEITTRG